MVSEGLEIRAFAAADEAAAVALWRDCGLLRPWNDPHKDIARKRLVQPELFLVACQPGPGEAPPRLVGTAMAGYDGHRGSVYYLAVAPEFKGQGIGRALMAAVEERLLGLGCPKLNVLVRTSNLQVVDFYGRLGYAQDEALSLGKRLIPDQ
ncbi:MAG: GNAT family acetyltransferase [Acidovorax sp.]|nr:GNAT family acetyltransferase [Acidovorax sp.]